MYEFENIRKWNPSFKFNKSSASKGKRRVKSVDPTLDLTDEFLSSVGFPFFFDLVPLRYFISAFSLQKGLSRDRLSKRDTNQEEYER